MPLLMLKSYKYHISGSYGCCVMVFFFACFIAQVANLLDCTTWGGAGPGLMDAVVQGALQAGKPVGGFKIAKEAGEWTASNSHPYLSSETYLTCR